jgi:hypothetical protein
LSSTKALLIPDEVSYASGRLREVWYAVHHIGGLPISVLFVDSDSVFESKRSALLGERTINPAQHQHFWELSHSTAVILHKNDRSFWRYDTLRRNPTLALFPVTRQGPRKQIIFPAHPTLKNNVCSFLEDWQPPVRRMHMRGEKVS